MLNMRKFLEELSEAINEVKTSQIKMKTGLTEVKTSQAEKKMSQEEIEIGGSDEIKSVQDKLTQDMKEGQDKLSRTCNLLKPK